MCGLCTRYGKDHFPHDDSTKARVCNLIRIIDRGRNLEFDHKCPRDEDDIRPCIMHNMHISGPSTCVRLHPLARISRSRASPYHVPSALVDHQSLLSRHCTNASVLQRNARYLHNMGQSCNACNGMCFELLDALPNIPFIGTARLIYPSIDDPAKTASPTD